MSKESTGTLEQEAYRVEARVKYVHKASPVELQDGILTENWRLVDFSKGFNPAGVPSLFNYAWGVSDFLTYESAKALAWTIIAQHQHKPIECRLVEYKVIQSYSSEKIKTLDEIIKEDWLERKFGKQPETEAQK